jgi:hypothetical protein
MAQDQQWIASKDVCQASNANPGRIVRLAMLNTLVLILSAANLLTQAGGNSPRLEARILENTSQKTIHVPPINDLESECDRDGNLYFHLDTHDVLFISADGKEGHKFTLPEVEKEGFQNFSLSPSGDLYVLTLVNDEFKVFTFDDDGVPRHPVTLQVPDSIFNEKFLAFADGAILFRGLFDQRAPLKMRGKSYTALFEPSGKLRKQLNSIATDDLRDVTKLGDLRDGAVAAGEDGNAYVLTSRGITVISENGLFVRHFNLQKPDPKAVAHKIYISGGAIAVVLKHSEGLHVTRDDFLLLDASTGEQFGLFSTSPESGTREVCYSRQEGFTFIRRVQGQETLIKAPLN